MQYSAEEMPANFNGDSTVSFVWRITGTIDWCLDFVAATGSFLPIKQILQETWMKKWLYVTLAQDCSGISRGIRADQNFYLGLKSVYKSQHANWSRSNSWRLTESNTMLSWNIEHNQPTNSQNNGFKKVPYTGAENPPKYEAEELVKWMFWRNWNEIV